MSAGCYLLFRDKVVFIRGERARENGAGDASWERYWAGEVLVSRNIDLHPPQPRLGARLAQETHSTVNSLS